ncbi:cell number regulator 11-like [Panicum miliaceum]|uniref:Cell number regulator 11-like n=1 Tax=Panicum miliaceum TaxID=4540 RepID=A0A3L6Q3A7_PANMI|nr:cell number regulator 11-like [Panicum miliaceum]
MANGAPPAGEWSFGLFDCFDDVGACCLTLFCPCVTFRRIAAIVDQSGGHLLRERDALPPAGGVDGGASRRC